MGTVYLSPDKVWDYYMGHRNELRYSEKLIADNPEYGINIVITGFMQGYCTVVVSADDTSIYEEDVNCARDCEGVVRMLYDDYLSVGAIELLDTWDNDNKKDKEHSGDEKFDALVEKNEIEVREAELDDAIWMLVETAVDHDMDFNQNMCDDIKEHILEYMWKKHKIAIYRPMYLVDENNEQFFEEYPYECMVFDE